MPNWCSNRVTVSGWDEESVQEINEIREIFSQDNPFAKIIPPPDWKTMPNDKGELPSLRQEFNQDGKLIYESYYFPDGKNDDRWYCLLYTSDAADEEDYFQIHFDTAWAPPEDVASELKRKYKKVSIQWFYDEPGCESAGYL